MSLKSTLETWIRRSATRRFGKVGAFEGEKFFDEVSQMLANEADSRALDDAARHQLLYRIQRKLMPRFVIADHGRVILEDDKFRKHFTRFSDENWMSFERKWNLKEFLKLVREVPGDFAECGVFRGGSAFLMCEEAGMTRKSVHLFDSFEGLSAPADNEDGHWSPGDLAIGEDEVKTNLAGFDNFNTYKGWIPTRFDDVAHLKFSFVHIDVDLEQPTRDSIAFFYPRMSPGSVLLLDDHGSAMCPGARQAALDYFADHNCDVLDIATGQGLVIKRV